VCLLLTRTHHPFHLVLYGARTGRRRGQGLATSPRTLRARGPPLGGGGAVAIAAGGGPPGLSPRGGPASGIRGGGGNAPQNMHCQGGSPSNRGGGGGAGGGQKVGHDGSVGEQALGTPVLGGSPETVSGKGSACKGGVDGGFAETGTVTVAVHLARCAVLCGEVEGALVEGSVLTCVQQHLARLQEQQLQPAALDEGGVHQDGGVLGRQQQQQQQQQQPQSQKPQVQRQRGDESDERGKAGEYRNEELEDPEPPAGIVTHCFLVLKVQPFTCIPAMPVLHFVLSCLIVVLINIIYHSFLLLIYLCRPPQARPHRSC